MKKAIAYIRVSTDKQTEGFSLENQLERIKSYCNTYGLDLIDTIADEGISGRNTKNREGFQKVMNYVTSKQIDAVIVYSLSRFARNTVDTLNNIEIMTKNNIHFHSISEKIDTSSAMGKFFLTIISAMAEMESNQISERVKSAVNFNKANFKTYCNSLMGFNTKSKQEMEINEEEMKTVFFIKERIKHTSQRKLVKELNDNNVPTKRGGKWHHTTIIGIVNNPIYDKIEMNTQKA